MKRDIKDHAGGLLLLAFGVFWAGYAITHYNLGSMRRMGPGMFPAGIGILIALMGIALIVTSALKTDAMPDIRPAAALRVLATVPAFALAMYYLGLIPAIGTIVLIAWGAEDRFRPLAIVALWAALSILAYTIFNLGLGLPMPAFRWRF